MSITLSSRVEKVQSSLSVLSEYLPSLPETERQRFLSDLQQVSMHVEELARVSLPSQPAASSTSLNLAPSELHSVMHSISDGFMVIDRNWRFVYVNEAAANRFPKMPGGLVGLNIWEAFPSLIGNPLHQNFLQVMQTRQPVSIMYQGLYSENWYEVNIYPTPTGITVYWLDRTYQKQAEQAREQLYRRLEETSHILGQSEAEARMSANIALAYAGQLEAIINHLVAGIIVYDREGRVQMANPYMITLFGFDPSLKTRAELFERVMIVAPNGERLTAEMSPGGRAACGELVTNQVLTLTNVQGRTYSILASSVPIYTGSELNGVVSIWNDMTIQLQREIALEKANAALRASEMALRESESRFRIALENAPITVFTQDTDLRYTWIHNPVRSTGEQMLGKRDDELMSPENAAELIAAKQTVIQSGQALHKEISLQIGEQQYDFLFSLEPLRDENGRVTGLSGAGIDMTEQRRLKEQQMEAATQMEVQHRLLEQRERERQEIARDIHDGPIQSMVSTIFNVQFAREALQDPQALELLEQIGASLKSAVRELRDLCNELRPPTLIRFGVSRAIRIHVEDFRERHPEIDLVMDLFDDGDTLPENVRVAYYRIFQEALNNVMRHAKASQIKVHFYLQGSSVILEVSDNGKGFSLPKDLIGMTRSGHYGMAGMKERAEAVGGILRYSSKPKHGTTIRVLWRAVELAYPPLH